MGRMVQLGEQVPTCYPGRVHFKDSQLPPPPAKWAEVKLPSESLCPQDTRKLQVRTASTPWRRGSKWCDVEREDLDKLGRMSAPFDGKFVARLVGPQISGVRPYYSANTTYNCLKAISCRMFRYPPAPRRGLWSWVAQFRDFLFSEYQTPPPEMSFWEWWETLPSHRKAPLKRAYEMWQENPVWQKKYGLFHSFLKFEPIAEIDKDKDGLVRLRCLVDRLINAPNDVTHVIAGPKIKPYMAWLKRQWSWDQFLFYGSADPETLTQWLQACARGGNKLIFWSDYSMFDNSHNSDTWEFVEHFYRQHRGDQVFQKVLNAWRVPQGTMGRDVKYRGRPMNASGRDDTAFANAVLNGVAMVLAVTASWFKLDVQAVKLAHLELIKDELRLSVCGDDALGFLPWLPEPEALAFITRAREHLKSFGFEAKMFCSDRLEDAVYLGHRPIQVGGQWYWAKTLGRCLWKLGLQNSLSGDGSAHFAGTCKMHMTCSKHVPVLRDIAEYSLKCMAGQKVNEWKENPDKPWETMGKFGPENYDEDAIASIAAAYTVNRRPCRRDLSPQDVVVTAADVRDLIRYVRETVHAGPCVLDHWLLRHMVWVDEL